MGKDRIGMFTNYLTVIPDNIRSVTLLPVVVGNSGNGLPDQKEIHYLYRHYIKAFSSVFNLCLPLPTIKVYAFYFEIFLNFFSIKLR